MLNQKDIADHLDMSQPAVSAMLERLGIDWKAADLSDIRVAYIRHIREQAAGRATVGNLDLATERAGLAKAQRERIEMQNAVTRGELAPKIMMEGALARAASKIAGVFDAIPGMVRRRVSSIGAEEIDMIAGEIAKARNIVAAMSIDDINADQPDSSPADIPEVDA